MEKLKQVYQQTVMNEEAMLEKIKNSAPKRHFSIISSKPIWVKIALAFSLVLFLAVAQTFLLPKKNTITIGHVTANDKLAYAMVGVDINPSIELFTDMDEIVIDVNALDADAKTLNLNSLIGLPIPQAVEKLIEMAKNAGFLSVGNPTTNTIIISTVSFGADGTKLISELKWAVLSSRAIDNTVKTYVIEGDIEDYEASERENLPLGIYLINGMIQNNGVSMSVADFVKDEDNLEVLEEMAEHATNSEMVSVIQALILELKSTGVDVSPFETRMNQEGEDLEELIDDIKDAFEPDEDEHDGESDDSIDDDSDSGSTDDAWSESEDSDDLETSDDDEKDD